jgi:hypothetical protein
MKRSRVNPISKSRAAENARRRKMMEENFGPSDTWRCWVRHRPALALIMGGCYGDVHGHEVIKRSQWSKGFLEPTNIILLCSSHNAWVENNPDTAHKLGLMKHQWEKE